MNALLTELDRRGCDVKGALERFIDDEEFYASCYKDALADEAFEPLRVGDSSNLETSYKKLLEMRNDYQKLA